MLSKPNVDVTFSVLFTVCTTATAVCEKVSRHELTVASMQHVLSEGNSSGRLINIDKLTFDEAK